MCGAKRLWTAEAKDNPHAKGSCVDLKRCRVSPGPGQPTVMASSSVPQGPPPGSFTPKNGQGNTVITQLTARGSQSSQARTKCTWPVGTTPETATTGQQNSSLPSYGPPTHSTWRPAPGALKPLTTPNPSPPLTMSPLPGQPCTGEMERGHAHHGSEPHLGSSGSMQSGGLDSHRRRPGVETSVVMTDHAGKPRMGGHSDSAAGSNEPVGQSLQESTLFAAAADVKNLQMPQGNRDATTPVPGWWWQDNSWQRHPSTECSPRRWPAFLLPPTTPESNLAVATLWALIGSATRLFIEFSGQNGQEALLRAACSWPSTPSGTDADHHVTDVMHSMGLVDLNPGAQLNVSQFGRLPHNHTDTQHIQRTWCDEEARQLLRRAAHAVPETTEGWPSPISTLPTLRCGPS